MVKVNIFDSECHRLCCMQMNLLELFSSDIITQDDYYKYKRVILDRLEKIESEDLNVKNA